MTKGLHRAWTPEELDLLARFYADRLDTAYIAVLLGRSDHSIDSKARALTIREKALGPDHPDVAESLENYAALLREVGREAEAAEMTARAEAIRAKRGEGSQ